MEYVTLANGVKMPILGYGVYQVTKEECERCVLDALRWGTDISTRRSRILTRRKSAPLLKSQVYREMRFTLPPRFGSNIMAMSRQRLP